MWGWLLCAAAAVLASSVDCAGAGAARLVCYAESGRTDGFSDCTHLVYSGDARGDKLDSLLKEYKKSNPRIKIIVRVAETDKDLRTLLKSKHAQGLELHDAHRALNKTKVLEAVEAARSAISSSGGGPLFLALPSHPELLAKYYDLRTLVKKVDLMMVQTHALGIVTKMTYHPSRLSGMWDMMNTDSVVDLVVGLGIPSSKIVISLPATARQFTLVNETLSTPGSPAEEDEPKEIDQAELCRQLQKGRWTLERDQDLSAPYAFKDKTWISFEDSSSVDVKGKYARVRGLAGLALHRADRDLETPCGPTLRTSLAKVLNQQSRAPRAAVLRSLEHEILSAPGHARALDALQVSPYRITQVVDSDGVIHSIREDTRTEFSCSRQGYFVHPRSCARFYRCVKFDQLSPEYTVFEFDCPAGLAFDSRYEVCVWPGSLPHSQACPGSSEIAPVPQTRFICPEHEGYYADPENCRWFFACLDHGKAPLTAYEFRCPFGLGFDAEKLKCDWPWLVPACGNIARYEAEAFGYSGAALTGAAGFQGQTADAINIAGHQSLVSGASLDNLVGIQSGFLTHDDALNSNFIASQEQANAQYQGAFGSAQNGLGSNGLAYQVGEASSLNNNLGLVQATQYNDAAKYSTGSLILDDYRLPTQAELAHNAQHGIGYQTLQSGAQITGSNGYSAAFSGKSQAQYQSSDVDNSGQYVHDSTGDYAEPYKHEGSPVVPYIHDDSGYKQSSDYYDVGRYSASQSGSQYQDISGKYESGKFSGSQGGQYQDNNVQYVSKYSVQNGGQYQDNNGRYVYENSGGYVEGSNGYRDDSGSYNADYSGSYTNDDSGKYVAGVYRNDGHIGSYNGNGGKSTVNVYQGSYSNGNSNYLSDSKAYTGSSHTLTAGAVNVGLVGKTTLVDAYNQDYQTASQGAYNTGSTQSFSHGVVHQNAHVPIVSQPAVSINHVGTDFNNLDGYSFVTTPTSSGIPTTATPFAVTTAIPSVTYKTTFVPEAPKTSIKQIFGYNQPAVTFVQPTVVAVKQDAPQIQVTDYQGINNAVSQVSQVKSESSGYEYSKPSIKFEDGISYTTPAPIVVSTFKPQGFSHSQQTLHKVESSGYDYSTATPVVEEPFKKLVAYTTGPSIGYAQPTVPTYTPQAFSQQTIHKVEASNAFVPSVSYEQPTIVQYTTPQPEIQVSTFQPQVFSQQTLHNVDASQVNTYSESKGYNYEKPSSGYEYQKPAIKFEEGVNTFQYSTPAPVVSTYQPQTYSHQTLHKVEHSFVPVSSTPAPFELTYHQPAVSAYENPLLKYTENVTPVYVQPTAHSFSHQTLHKVESSKVYNQEGDSGYSYEAPKTVIQHTTPQPITIQHVESGYNYEAPKTVLQYSTPQPVVSTYEPQVFSHQTLHKVDTSKVNAYSESSGYDYEQSAIKFEEAPKTVIQYSTPAPAVVSTYSPQSYSSQTIHKVEANKVNAYSESGSGYSYEQPAVKLEEAPKIVQYSTPAPAVSTYRPQSYSHQTIHKVEAQQIVPVSSTPQPRVELTYQEPAVSIYQNPILKYTENFTPAKPTPVVYTQNYQPIVQQHEVSHVQPIQYETSAQQNLEISQEGYSYNQPEIQRNVETLNTGKTYSDASVVSHQYYHQSNGQSQDAGKNVVFVSSTPASLIYEDHYSEYEAPKQQTYQAPEYVPPKTDYQQTYSVSTARPIVQQSSVVHQDQYNYQSEDYSQQYDNANQQLSFSSHVVQPERIESYHVSSFPGTKITTKYNQASYESPEIQIGNRAEEYLPPVVSTVTPIVTSTYKPVYSSVSTTHEYLPPQPEYTAQEYLPPKVENEYLPPSTTARPVTTTYKPTVSTTREYLPPQPEYNAAEYLPPKEQKTYLPPPTTARPIQSTNFKAEEYLPPNEAGASVINFESFGYKNEDLSNIGYNGYQEYTVSSTAAPVRKPNIVIETKNNLLGFGTVGPDAGLVSAVTYTTSAPISSTYAPELPVRRARPKYKSTTQVPYVESTTAFKAPDYLPPDNVETNLNFNTFGLRNDAQIAYNPYQQQVVVSTSAPVQRKQNIVIQTAKSQLGYGTVGYDAGLVSQTYSTGTPIVTSTYAPEKQELVEVSPLPLRRSKPKVAVVTKINDFNPLLVRKLGAVCSCQSPVLVLKGRRPTVQVQQDFDDYSNDFEDGRGDIADSQWAQKSARIQTVKTVTTPIVTSTFNPIIVPDDSYYQDFQESRDYNVDITPKSRQTYLENIVTSTPQAIVSSTGKVVRIRPRVEAVTVAPTYQTVLLNQEVAPTAVVKQSDGSGGGIDSQAFDRYGPGGWRSRDETLQGSIDCQRAGLFRHPKQCNKFYACRWDCTKQRFTLHVFNCPVQLSFDPSIGACNWPSQGPACQGDTLLTNTL